MMRLKLLLAVCVLVLIAPMARAQNGVYAQFTGMSLHNVNNAPSLQGATVGVYIQDSRRKLLGGGVDFRGSFVNGSGNSSLDSGMAGLRVVLRPRRVPLVPYAELMIGVADSTLGKKERSDFTDAVIAGVDWRLTRHIDWRVIDFSYARVAAETPFDPVTYGTGIVLRFGR